jgi:electron transfer flavoprotein beta subunit
MKLLVCLKQVPDMESKFRIDGEGVWYERTDLAWRMNEYDEYGVEQAVRVKERSGGDLTVLCIGPDRVKETMKKALAMGCDRGVHLLDDTVHRRDPLAIAGLIADFARDQGFDLIFCGMQSQDRGSAQVGPMVAELLGIEAVTTIVDFTLDGQTLVVKRELEGGVRAVVKTVLPALVTCQLGLNTPRYPTLPNIMKAKKKELLSIVAAATTPEAVQTIRMGLPEKKGGGLILEGDAADIAERLIKILKEKTGIPA